MATVTQTVPGVDRSIEQTEAARITATTGFLTVRKYVRASVIGTSGRADRRAGQSAHETAASDEYACAGGRGYGCGGGPGMTAAVMIRGPAGAEASGSVSIVTITSV